MVEPSLIPGFQIQSSLFALDKLAGYAAIEGSTGEAVEVWALQDSAWNGAPETLLQAKVRAILSLKYPALLSPTYALRLRGMTAFVIPKFEGSTLDSILARTPMLSSKSATQIGLDIASCLAYLNFQKVVRAELSASSVLVGAQPPARLRYTGLLDMIRPPDLNQYRPQVGLQELGSLLYRCVTGQAPNTAMWVDPMVLNSRVWLDLSRKIKELIFTPGTAADAARDFQKIMNDNVTRIGKSGSSQPELRVPATRS